MTREEILELNDKAWLLDKEYDSAIIGVAERINLGPVVAYNSHKVIELIAKDMIPEKIDIEAYGDVETAKLTMAEEFFDFNIKGAWMGENTPVFITKSLEF